ncbi:Fc.00g055120.m01.CDS01 [Cosmosporella sp. VM-42]
MLAKNIVLALSAATLTLAGTPLESGTWVEDQPGYSQQQCAGGSVNGNTFSIPKSPNGSTSGSGCSNGHLRAERRYNDDYSTGVHQFGGEFKINSMSGSRISIKQTFNGSSGPYFILGVEQGGRLYSVEGGATIATGVATVGSTVRINTVHNANIHRFSVYVNGKEMFRDENAPSGSFYDKIGAYTTDSGTGDLSITWNDVQFWHRV